MSELKELNYVCYWTVLDCRISIHACVYINENFMYALQNIFVTTVSNEIIFSVSGDLHS